MMCRWLSIRPGTDAASLKVNYFAPAAGEDHNVSLKPTAMKRPSLIATASAWGLLRSSVVN